MRQKVHDFAANNILLMHSSVDLREKKMAARFVGELFGNCTKTSSRRSIICLSLSLRQII